MTTEWIRFTRSANGGPITVRSASVLTFETTNGSGAWLSLSGGDSIEVRESYDEVRALLGLPPINPNLPCPFCGGLVDPTGWLGKDGDGKATSGPECDDCGATASDLVAWNRRAGA